MNIYVKSMLLYVAIVTLFNFLSAVGILKNFHMICYHLYSILFELQYMIAAVYCYFSLFHSLCLLSLSVLFSVLLVFSFFVLLYIFVK